MSHKSLLVFASVLCSDEDLDEIMLAATLFIIYFCNKISISHLFHCMLACVKTVQILFWMYSLCYTWNNVLKITGIWRQLKHQNQKGRLSSHSCFCHGYLDYPNRCFHELLRSLHGNGQICWKYYFHHIKNESYKQSAGSMIDQCCRLNCFGKGVLLKLDNFSL